MFIVKWKPEALPRPWVAGVSFVHDGDTVRVGSGAAGILVRIWGIDAPEIGQYGFRQCRDALAGFLRGKKVTVHSREFDKYGRVVARLVTAAGEDVGGWMLENGLAWWEYHFARESHEYRALQKKARKRGLGIWARQPWGFAPWVWRMRHRVGYAAK